MISSNNSSLLTIAVRNGSYQDLSYSNYSINSEDSTNIPTQVDAHSVKKLIKKDAQVLKSKKINIRRVQAKIIENLYYSSKQDDEDENGYKSRNSLIEQNNTSCQDLLSSTASSNSGHKICCAVEKPFDNYKYFMCAGDIMIELYHDDEVELSQERRICSYRNLKRVTKAENFGGSIRVILESNQNIVKDFSYICCLLETMQSQRMYKFSKLLKDYQVFIKGYSSYIESIVDYYKQTNMNDFMILRELRQAYYLDYINKITKTLPQDDFYIAVQTGPSFSNFSPNYNMFQMSPALIALLGVDQTQLMHLYLRNGIRELTVSNNKQENYIDLLERLMGILQTGKIEPFKDYPVELFTFDNIVIKAKSNSDYLDVPLPKALEYKSTTGVYRNLDKVNIITYSVDVSEIQKLIKIRKQPEYKQIIAEQLDHFEYSVHSSIFIEKYYKDHVQSLENLETLM